MRSVALMMIWAFFAGATHAQTTAATDRIPGPDKKRIELLIEQLASRNKAPTIRGNADRGEDQTIRFPDDYDELLQVPVYSAIQALLAEDDAAMDLLLEHSKDARYSFSVNSYKDDNVTVGEACMTIATAMLTGFEDELHVLSRSQFGVFPPMDAPFDDSIHLPPLLEYWRQHKDVGIAKIQIEAIDAALEYFRNADAETAIPWHPDAQRLEVTEFNRLRDENIKTLTAIRRYVNETGKRYRTNRIDGAHHCLFGLPWSGRRFNK
jgi:hypothetical protein